MIGAYPPDWPLAADARDADARRADGATHVERDRESRE
jgi:hypothetical protein